MLAVPSLSMLPEAASAQDEPAILSIPSEVTATWTVALDAKGLEMQPVEVPVLLAKDLALDDVRLRVTGVVRDGVALGEEEAVTAALKDHDVDGAKFHVLTLKPDATTLAEPGTYKVNLLLTRIKNDGQPVKLDSGCLTDKLCQFVSIDLSRPPAKLSIPARTIAVSLDIPLEFGGTVTVPKTQLTIRETGSKSGANVDLMETNVPLLDANKRQIGSDHIDVAISEPKTISRMSAGENEAKIKFNSVEVSDYGTYVATLRVKAPEIEGGLVETTLTIVVQLARWWLVIGVVLGIIFGWLVRVRLTAQRELATAKAAARRTYEELLETVDGIRDQTFQNTVSPHMATVNTALSDSRKKKIVDDAIADAKKAVEAAVEDYAARLKTEAEWLASWRSAAGGLRGETDVFSPAHEKLLATIKDASTLLDDTFVATVTDLHTIQDNRMVVASSGLEDDLAKWAVSLEQTIQRIRHDWPDSVPNNLLEQEVAAAKELVTHILAGIDEAKIIKAMSDAAGLAHRVKLQLGIRWWQGVESMANQVIGDLQAKNIYDPVPAIEAALQKLSDSLRLFNRTARPVADMASLSEELHTAIKQGRASVPEPSIESAVVSETPIPVLENVPEPPEGQAPELTLQGPVTLSAWDASEWILKASRDFSTQGIIWKANGVIVARDTLALTYQPPRSGSLHIEVSVANADVRDEKHWTGKVVGTLKPAAFWDRIDGNLDLVQTAVAGVLIGITGFFIFDDDLISLTDVFKIFIWGFFANIGIAGLQTATSSVSGKSL